MVKSNNVQWCLPGLTFVVLLTGCGASARGPYQTMSLLGEPLYALPRSAERVQLEQNLANARREVQLAPDEAERLVWLGRRLGYLWRMNEAVEVYSRALEHHPDYAPLYRHRGHRYISLRKFDMAIADLQAAAGMIRGAAPQVEQDGMPNERNIPLTTLGFNVWYHLGLAYYLQGDYTQALSAYQECMKHTRGYDDNRVAVTDWMYMALRRLHRDQEAAELLEPIRADMDIMENTAYHKRLLMYKGELAPEDLLSISDASDLDLATMGYGVGNWYLYNDQPDRAVEIFQRVVSGKYWPAFGYIAAEVDLARENTKYKVKNTK